MTVPLVEIGTQKTSTAMTVRSQTSWKLSLPQTTTGYPKPSTVAVVPTTLAILFRIQPSRKP